MGTFFYSGNDGGDYDFYKLCSMRKEKYGIGDEMATPKKYEHEYKAQAVKAAKERRTFPRSQKGCLLCRP